eukprot:2487342-Pleurochrysis_carterae.AAC.1
MLSIAIPVKAVALSARCEMIRMRSRPLPVHDERSSLRMVTYGRVREIGCGMPAGTLAASLALARIRTAAGIDERARLNVGSTGEGKRSEYG